MSGQQKKSQTSLSFLPLPFGCLLFLSPPYPLSSFLLRSPAVAHEDRLRRWCTRPAASEGVSGSGEGAELLLQRAPRLTILFFLHHICSSPLLLGFVACYKHMFHVFKMFQKSVAIVLCKCCIVKSRCMQCSICSKRLLQVFDPDVAFSSKDFECSMQHETYLMAGFFLIVNGVVIA